MTFFAELRTALNALCDVVGEDAEATAVPSLMQRLGNDTLVSLIEAASALVRGGESVRIAATGVVAARSTRETGHNGLAQQRGHRSAVSLIQDLTGTSRADAAKQVRLGEALATGCLGHAGGAEAGRPSAETGMDAAAAGASAGPAPARPWHAVLGDALMAGIITSAQHDAIFRGLGDPPTAGAMDSAMVEATKLGTGDDLVADAVRMTAEITVAWQVAATQLIDEAAVRTVEELASAARTIRDLLDPVGATERFDARFDGRSFRTWTDREGTRRGTFAFDDEGGAWIDAIIATALRPRRGGPRFVDVDEKARADELAADPRTNDQLAYDLVMDVLRAGALADAQTVFGTRQAGIRVLATVGAHADSREGRPAVALLEDSDLALPGWIIATHGCDSGTISVIHDEFGNPLDLGRETRLYTAKQRIALAIRDGGCRIPDCDRPASYCEAHHIDPYATGGRTDIDRGILLCRSHHMNLHHHGWRITRHGKEEFLLHRPGRPSVPLPMRLARRYAFGDLGPPPRRFRPAA